MDKKSVIELVRVSTRSQASDDKAGIPAQRAENRRTAARFGLEIVHTIQMSDVSGASVLRAPEIQELLKLISKPEIHGVVAREFSRLMRPDKLGDFALLQEFADTNTILYLSDGATDFNSKSGRLTGTVRALFAGMERQETLEKIWGAKEVKRRAGKFPQSKICLPTGVGYEENRGYFYKPESEKIREAFRLIIAGETSYFAVARKVGVEPVTLRNLLRNPIFTGWRVYNQRRDPSSSARRYKPDGRQADRPKIKREKAEIIRKKVIAKPLISVKDFLLVQRILDSRKSRSWRSREGYEHRFIYNGYLYCTCGIIIYSKFQRQDYYVCKGRHRLKSCSTRSMRRDKLEPLLDAFFSEELTDEKFLQDVAFEWKQQELRGKAPGRAKQLKAQIMALKAKRERILDLYIEGNIDGAEKQIRLDKTEQALSIAEEALSREKPTQVLSAEVLSGIFSPFQEWGYLTREEKRNILSSASMRIRVADYKIQGLYFFCSDNLTPTDRDSWPPPA